MSGVIPGEHIWLSDAEQGFLPCLVTEAIKPGDAGKSVDVMLPDGRTQRREVTRKEADALHRVHKQNFEPLADMLPFEDLSEPPLVHNLRLRFAADDIYTDVGDILPRATRTSDTSPS